MAGILIHNGPTSLAPPLAPGGLVACHPAPQEPATPPGSQAEPAGAPNVVVLVDDIGVGASSAFGGRAGRRPPSGWAELPSGGAADGQQG
jgi:hypothetical protein